MVPYASHPADQMLLTAPLLSGAVPTWNTIVIQAEAPSVVILALFSQSLRAHLFHAVQGVWVVQCWVQKTVCLLLFPSVFSCVVLVMLVVGE